MWETDKLIEKMCKSSYYVSGRDWIKDFCEHRCSECTEHCTQDVEVKTRNFNTMRDKIRLHLRNYMQLDNINLLFGAGTSIHLGSISIRRIPKQIEEWIYEETEIKDLFISLVLQFQKKETIKRNENGEIEVPLEDFINYLLGLQYVVETSKQIKICEQLQRPEDVVLLEKLIRFIKISLFKLCDLDNQKENWFKELHENEIYKNDMYLNGDYYYHKQLIKSLLQRPLNLRRANIFTTNYDLAFENSFDELGVKYIDGFEGFHRRSFRPESYDYDLFYPGSATEGKVRKIERVIKYFKLHGSISWVKDRPSAYNYYGLTEKSINEIRQNMNIAGDMMIYPTACKKGYTLDFPYSELFRQFAAAITQPQSVLFCIGYSFFDEHINDIIFQALSLPSFTLIIVDYIGTKGNSEIQKLKNLDDPRIIILEGDYLGDFKHFSTDILPHMHEIDIRANVLTSLRKLHDSDANTDGENNV